MSLGAHRDRKRVSDSLEMELKVVANHLGARNQTPVIWKSGKSP